MNERIRELRKALGLTLERFGEALGVQKSAVSKWERGENSVPEQIIKSICREFDVNEVWLKTGEGKMFKELTGSEKTAVFLADVLKDEEPSFRKRLIEALADLDSSDWKVIEAVCDSIIEKRAKKENQD